MAWGCMRAAAAVWFFAAASTCFSQVPEVETHPHDPAAAKAEFEAARKQEKELIGELTVMRAEIQQPGVHKKAIAARFEAARDRIPATKERHETAALALAMDDAKNLAAG